MPETQREKQLRALYDAFNSRDVDSCLEAFRGDLVERMTIEG